MIDIIFQLYNNHYIIFPFAIELNFKIGKLDSQVNFFPRLSVLIIGQYFLGGTIVHLMLQA